MKTMRSTLGRISARANRQTIQVQQRKVQSESQHFPPGAITARLAVPRFADYASQLSAEGRSAAVASAFDKQLGPVGNSSKSSNTMRKLPMCIPLPELAGKDTTLVEKVKEESMDKSSSSSYAGGSNLRFSRLKNGLRVASMDRGGSSSSVGLFVQVGSRFEILPKEQGCTQLLELVPLRNGDHFSAHVQTKLFEQLGAGILLTPGRENFMYKADCVRENVDVILPVMLANACGGGFSKEDVGNAAALMAESHAAFDGDSSRKKSDKMTESVDSDDNKEAANSSNYALQNSENFVYELAHAAAYAGKGLGAVMLPDKLCGFDYASLTNSNQNSSEKDAALVEVGRRLEDFAKRCHQPERMVLGGINVDHDKLCELADWSCDELGLIGQQGASESSEALKAEQKASMTKYEGGFLRHKVSSSSAEVLGSSSAATDNNASVEEKKLQMINQAHVCVAFELPGGWNGEHVLTATVLQSLLGGGGSFSTGGPGKGMHSRIFTNVLNKYYWVESCNSFSHVYSDSGIFGIYGVLTQPEHSEVFLQKVIGSVLASLQFFSVEEVERAKNSLKSSVFVNLESNNVALEDVGRQLLMSGKVATGNDFAALVDAVRAEDLQRVAKALLESKPTVVHYAPSWVGDVDYQRFVDMCSGLKKNVM